MRGSTGYGMEFQNANIKDLSGGDLKDEIAGMDFLKARGSIVEISASVVSPETNSAISLIFHRISSA
jgi:hypothetical protein